MAKRVSGCGCLLVSLVGVIIVVVVTLSKQDAPIASRPAKTQDAATAITAELSDFKVDGDFSFKLTVKNLSDKPQTLYAVVFGEEMRVSPPRRSAWPFSVYFTPDRSSRGNLRSSDISRSWQSRAEDSKGARIDLSPRGEDVLEGALGLGSTSPHEAWKGQPLDRRAKYGELHLWIYSEKGQIVFEKKYNIQ